jgi:hypothetical protein
MALMAHKTQQFPGKRAIIRGNPPAVHDQKGPKASTFIEFYKKQTLQPVARHVAADPSSSGREVAVVAGMGKTKPDAIGHRHRSG